MKRAGLLLTTVLFAMGCNGFSKLDFSTLGRGTWQRPDEVVRTLDLRRGDRVADLGAGHGYFVPYLADAVGPQGRVYAVDVDAETVDGLRERFGESDPAVEPVLAGVDDPKLPDGSIDLVLLVNTYHHIEDRKAYFERLRQDLSARGRVAVIEPNAELGAPLSWALDEGHKSSAEGVAAEMDEAGYARVASHAFLAVQIFEVFTPEGRAE